MPQKRTTKTPATKQRPTKRNSQARKNAYSRKSSSSFERVRPSVSQRGGMFGGKTTPGNTSSTGQANASGFSPEVLLTRRNLLIGAGIVGGIAAIGGISSAASSAFTETETIESISVPESAVTELSTLNEVTWSDYIKLSTSYKLPYGTLVWADNNSVAACLVPQEESHPLNTIRLFYFSSANAVEVIKNAQGADEGFEIFDVRCSTEGIIWTECNVYEDRWRIYTARVSNASVSNIVQVDEGDANWDTPSIAACENSAFWQVVPNSDGEYAKEKAQLRAVHFGESSYSVVLEALKTFACRIVAAEDGIVCAPRMNSATRYYQLTKVLASDFSIADQLILPYSMTPCNIGYGKSGFAFAFENIYSYGDGIANLGTYTPMKAVNAYSYNDIPWFRFSRTPSATPAWCDEFFVVKSTRAICGVHFASNNFFVIDIPSDTASYGEYLVSSGACNKIVGLSQISSSTDSENDYALLRVFSPSSQSLGSAFSE